MTVPSAQLSMLHRADGSATYSQNGYTVLCAVNGPIEVQRRDELPQEAAIEVNLRPAIGVGSPKERHIESLLHTTLRHIIHTHAHPRTLIQLTLQILSTPEDDQPQFSKQTLPQLPALLNASLLALLSASIPLLTTFSAAIATVSSSGKITLNPDSKTLKQATSVHVLAFSADGNCVFDQSEGEFDMDVWEKVHDLLKKECCDDDGLQHGGGDEMEDREAPSMHTMMRRIVEAKVEGERAWKNG